MSSRFMPRNLLIAAMVLVLGGMCGAKTIYVRTDGNDSNDGLTDTTGGAKLTFLGATLAAAGGDTIQFAPGTYNEGGQTRIVFFNDLTYRSGNPNQKAVLSTLAVRISASVSGLTFQDLIFDNGFTHREVFYVENGGANLTLRGCEFRNPLLAIDSPAADARRGLLMVEGCNSLLVEDCKFSILANVNIPVNVWCLANLRDVLHVGFASSNWTVRNSEFLVQRDAGQTTDVDGGGLLFHEAIANVLVEGCTFTTVFESFRIENSDIGDLPRAFTNVTFRNNGIANTVTSNALYLGSLNVYTDMSIRDNLFTAVEDTAIWLEGGGSAVVDGMEIVGNDLRDVGYNGQGTDQAVRIDDALINPTAGKKVSIRNNSIRRPNAGGDECLWLNAAGPGLEVVANVIENYNGSPMLVDGSEKNVGTGALLSPVVNDNVILSGGNTGILVRVASEAVDGLVIENNQLSNVTPIGINIRNASATNLLLRLNTLTGNNVGMRVSAPGAVVTQNSVFTCSDPAGGGILLEQSTVAGAPSGAAGSIVSFNVLAANRNYGILLSTALQSAGANARIFNNTLVSNVSNGILIGINGCHVYNNIIALHPGIGLQLSAPTPGTIGYNLLYNQVVGGANYSGFTTTPLAGDISADPRFQNASMRDYHLQSNSPAIGAGAALVGGNLSADGSDMGAFPTSTVSAGVDLSEWSLYR